MSQNYLTEDEIWDAFHLVAKQTATQCYLTQYIDRSPFEHDVLQALYQDAYERMEALGYDITQPDCDLQNIVYRELAMYDNSVRNRLIQYEKNLKENKIMKKSRLNEMTIDQKAKRAADRVVRYFNLRWDPVVDDPFVEGTDCYVDVQNYIQGCVNGAQVESTDSIYVQEVIEGALEDFIVNYVSPLEYEPMQENKRISRKPVKESVYYEEDISTVPTPILQYIQDCTLGYYLEKWDGVNPKDDYNCRNDLEAEMEDCAIEKGYDPEEEFVTRDLQNWVIEPICDYYKETYGY